MVGAEGVGVTGGGGGVGGRPLHSDVPSEEGRGAFCLPPASGTLGISFLQSWVEPVWRLL